MNNLSIFNSSVRRFLIRLAFLSLGVWLIALGLDHLVTTGLRNTQEFFYVEWNDILKGRITADVAVLGSSRAWQQISPKIMDDVLQVNSYNLGLDGYRFEMIYTRYQLYRKLNRTPKTIILILDSFSLDKVKDPFMNKQFLPYWDIEELMARVKAFHYFTWSDLHIPFVRYLGNTREIFIGMAEYFHIHHYQSSKYKGFEANDIPWDGVFDTYKKANPKGITQTVCPEIEAQLVQFLTDCKKDKIQVIMVYTPEYIEAHSFVRNHADIIARYRALAKSQTVPFLDFSSDPICRNKAYFFDSQHLNKTGSEIFTRQLALMLKPYIHFRN